MLNESGNLTKVRWTNVLPAGGGRTFIQGAFAHGLHLIAACPGNMPF